MYGDELKSRNSETHLMLLRIEKGNISTNERKCIMTTDQSQALKIKYVHILEPAGEKAILNYFNMIVPS